jgi:hypothetical protein
MYKKFLDKKLIFDIVFLILLCLFYSFWFCEDLTKQGLYCDVALIGNAALSMVRNLHYNAPSVNILGRAIPLMTNSYNAATDIFATVPWVYLFGNNPIALYLPGFIWGVLAIVFLYLVSLLMFHDRSYCSFVSLMFATTPSFIVASRLGLFAGNLTIFFALAAIFLLFCWRVKRKRYWLFMMGLALGIGIAGKIQFIWFTNSLLLYILFIKILNKRSIILKNIIVTLSGIAVGAFSLILANVKSNFLTVRFISKYLLVSREGVSNLNYVTNFLEILRESWSLINGSALSDKGDLYANPLGVPLFLFGVFFIISQKVYNYIKCRQVDNNVIILPLFICVFVILQSPFTPTLFNVHHILLVLPFMCMVSCLPLYVLREKPEKRICSGKKILHSSPKLFRVALRFVFLSLLIFLICYNYRFLKDCKAYRNIHGGQEAKWDIMSDVKKYILEKKIKRVGLGDSGLRDPLSFLSGFDLELDEVFYSPYRDLSKEAVELKLVERFNRDKEGYYLFREDELVVVHFFSDFENICKRYGKKVDLFYEFKSPEGSTVFKLYKIY